MSPPPPPTLTWSAKLSLTPASLTPSSLVGDKILLPQSALEQLLSAVQSSAAGSVSDADDVSWDSVRPRQQRQLPHPLTFKLLNPVNGRFSHAAPLEFSGEEGRVGLSSLLRGALGVGDGDGQEGVEMITVVSKELPRGRYVRLRPLEAGYGEEDWKALLERYLRTGFTTLTVGEVLSVGGEFRFLIDRLEPEEAVCIVDTDLEVDIEPLSEEQARETLKRQLLARKGNGNSASGGDLKLDEIATGEVLPGEYHFYELSQWVSGEPLVVELGDVEDGEEVDIFVSTSKQHHKPRADEHVWGDFGSKYPKRIEISGTNVELVDAKNLVVGVHGYTPIDPSPEDSTEDENRPRHYYIKVTQSSLANTDTPPPSSPPPADSKQCKNCTQWIPTRTILLHENFCQRNNIVCPLCHQITHKATAPTHWHCKTCTAHGNNAPKALQKHTSTHHHPRNCPACKAYTAANLLDLSYHRTTTCASKPIICRFCHLLVAQDHNPSPQVLLSSLTPHEHSCGGRTTDCPTCTRIVRLRDLETHMKNHDLDRLSTPTPTLCNNVNCARTVTGALNPFGLCAPCFGPLYAPGYDPTGGNLRRRLERRLVQQVITGCGRGWCRNSGCKSGRTNVGMVDGGVGTVAEALLAVRGVVERVEGGGGVGLCVDEETTRRREMVDRIGAEGRWDVAWVVKAVESVCASSTGDCVGREGRVREWLERNGVRKGERG